jgi:hypothetical protein
MGCEIGTTSLKLRYIYKIAPALADDIVVQHLGRKIKKEAKSFIVRQYGSFEHIFKL